MMLVCSAFDKTEEFCSFKKIQQEMLQQWRDLINAYLKMQILQNKYMKHCPKYQITY